MSRTTIGVSLVALIALGALWVVSASRFENNTTAVAQVHQQVTPKASELDAPTHARQADVSMGLSDRPSEPAPQSLAVSEPTPPTRSFLPEAEFEGSRKSDLVLLAKSPEEAAWLRKHGYPSLEEWRSRESIPDEVLATRAAGGDLVAEVMQAERRAQSGDLSGALAQLDAALVKGSVFAPLVKAQVLDARVRAKQSGMSPSLGGAPRRRDAPIIGELQLALMLGDHQAPQILRSMQLQAISSADITAGMQSAAISLVDLNERRLRLGLPPLVVTPRPGADGWLPGRDPPGTISYWKPGG